MVIIRVTSGNASVHSLHAALQQLLNSDECENITPYGNDLLLSLSSIRAAVAVIKRN